MAISSFTGNLTNTIGKINEVSTANNWGITATTSNIPSNSALDILDADNHVLIKMTGIASDRGADNHGVRLFYNNGSSYIGYLTNYGSNIMTASLYIASHGFIIVNNSYRTSEGICAAWVNINDDGTIIYGGTGTTDANNNLYDDLICCKYDESSYQPLNFTPHANTSGTTLCNMIAVGSLGEPSVAQYAFYSPVYQTRDRGIVDVEGEQYVTIGYWYIKD